MDMDQGIGAAADRVMARLVAGLEIEFGRGAAEDLAQRFLEAEEAGFCWEARVEERWLGDYESLEEDDIILDRIAILGRLDGRWVVATMLVDGDGNPQGMLGRRTFNNEKAARRAHARAR